METLTLPSCAETIITERPDLLPPLPKVLPRAVLEEEKAKLRKFLLPFYNEKKHLKNDGGKILTYPFEGDEDYAWKPNNDLADRITLLYNNDFNSFVKSPPYGVKGEKGFAKQFRDAFAKYQVILNDINRNRKAKLKSIYITIVFKEDEISYDFSWSRYEPDKGHSHNVRSIHTYKYAPTDFL